MVKSPAKSLRSIAGAGEVVGDFVEILKSVIALIEQFELESAELAEALHGGRFEGDDDGAGNSEEWAAQPIEDGGGGVFASLALLVRAKGQEDQAGVGGAASEAEAGDGEGALDFRKILGDGGHLRRRCFACIRAMLQWAPGWRR